MDILNKQCDSIATLFIVTLTFLLTLFPELVVELHQK